MDGMTHKKSATKLYGLLPYAVIVGAVAGDPCAMRQVLDHYDSQIDYWASCLFRDEEGNCFYAPNEEIRDRLTSKLMQAVLRFKISCYGME
jgi:hypothetical protein